MTKLKTVERTAVTAFGHSIQPSIAVGTAAGVVDTSFTSSAVLELFDLNLADASPAMKPMGSVAVSSKYNNYTLIDLQAESYRVGRRQGQRHHCRRIGRRTGFAMGCKRDNYFRKVFIIEQDIPQRPSQGSRLQQHANPDFRFRCCRR